MSAAVLTHSQHNRAHNSVTTRPNDSRWPTSAHNHPTIASHTHTNTVTRLILIWRKTTCKQIILRDFFIFLMTTHQQHHLVARRYNTDYCVFLRANPDARALAKLITREHTHTHSATCDQSNAFDIKSPEARKSKTAMTTTKATRQTTRERKGERKRRATTRQQRAA